MRDRIKKAFKHTLIGKIINVLNPIVLIPLYINAWGVDIYGTWLVLFGLASYVSLLDFGLSHYLPNKFTILKNNFKNKAYKLYLNQVISFYLVYLFFILSTACFIYYVIDFDFAHMINSDLNNNNNNSSMTLFLLFIMNNSISVFLNFTAYIYIANNNYYIINKRDNIKNFLNISLSIIILVFSSNPVYVAMTMVGISLLIQLFSMLDIHFNYFSFSEFKFFLSLKFIVKHMRKSIWFTGVKVSDIFTQTIPIFIIELLLGASHVVIFSVHKTFINMTVQIKSLVDDVIWRESTIFYAQAKNELISIIYIFLQRLTSLYFILITSMYLVVGEMVFNSWMKDIEYDSKIVLLLLSIAYVKSFSTLAEIIVYSRNYVKEIIIIKIIFYILLIFISYIYRFNNLEEILYLLLCIELSSSFTTLKKVNKVINISNNRLFRNVFLLNLLFIVLVYFNTSIIINISILIVAMSAFYFSMNDNERQLVKKLF